VLRFHLDENVNPGIAKGLRQRGIDVTTTNETGLTSAPDDRQLAFALSQTRVLVTHDSDFLALHSQGVRHSGIVYCAPGRRSVGEMLRGLILMAEVFEAEELSNHVEYL